MKCMLLLDVDRRNLVLDPIAAKSQSLGFVSSSRIVG
jgi:hypothetical protein